MQLHQPRLGLIRRPLEKPETNINPRDTLSSNRVQVLSHISADEVRLLRRRFVRSDQNQMVEMKPLFFELMLNIMMRMIAGKRFYGNVEHVEETRKFQEIVTETLCLGGTTNISDFLPLLKTVCGRGYENSLIELQKKRDNFMQCLIEENRKVASTTTSPSKDKNNVIQVLLSMQESDPEYYTGEISRGLMQALFSSGTDTSSGLMEWAMSLMLSHSEVLEKAGNELDDCIGPDRLVDESDLVELTYLHCIIKETMGLYPVGALLPHESSEECIVSGYRIPRGTMLLVNSWAIQNDPKTWDEPTKFMPERFEGGHELGVRDGFKLIPFGSGRRGCPGESLGIRMVGLSLASLIQCFEWEMLEKKIDMTERLGLTLSKAHLSQVKCKPCQTMEKILSQI